MAETFSSFSVINDVIMISLLLLKLIYVSLLDFIKHLTIFLFFA